MTQRQVDIVNEALTAYFDQETDQSEKIETGEEEFETACERQEGFFSTEDVKKVGNVKLRLFYDKARSNYCVFLMKINPLGNESGKESTYMCVPADLVTDFYTIMEQLCDEVIKL
jgi:hypothetical protein